MTSQNGQHTIIIHILSNISKNKCNQTMQFCQLMKFKMKSYIKCNGEASIRPFYKKIKSRISLYQQSEVMQSLLLLHVQVVVYKNKLKHVKTKWLTSCSYLI